MLDRVAQSREKSGKMRENDKSQEKWGFLKNVKNI